MAVFWSDTFTEAANTALTSHTPEVGGSYSYLTAIDGGTSANVNGTTDRAEFPAGTFTSARPSIAPGAADYTVTGSCVFTDSDGVLRVYLRVSGSNGYCGEARLNGTYNIYRVDGGGFTSIVSGTLSGLSGFTSYAYSFGVTGSSLSMTFNGTTISVSNSTYTAAGAAAVGGRAVDVDSVTADDSTTGGDTTPPTLSSPTGTGGLGVCSGTVSTNEGNGTLRAVATASATQPSVAQIKAGQDHTGAAALRAVSQSVAATGTQTVASGAISGGAGTRYLHYLHTDAASNDSNRVTSASFEVTAAATSLVVTVPDAAGQSGFAAAVLSTAAPTTGSTVIRTATSLTFNPSGQVTIDISGLGIAVGAYRWVTLTNSDGTTTQSPAPVAASGPVIAS
jgi:hypothetical protein